MARIGEDNLWGLRSWACRRRRFFGGGGGCVEKDNLGKGVCKIDFLK